MKRKIAATPIKPPLELIPEKLWLEKRCVELSEAMTRSLKMGNLSSVKQWMEELGRHINQEDILTRYMK